MGHPLPSQVTDKSFETQMLRKTTDYFILSDPVEIVLIPREQVTTETGGKEWRDGDPRPVQTFKLIETVSTGDMSRGEGGVRERQAEFVLLGQWDAIVKPYDHWEQDGQRLEVTAMMPNNDYEVRAIVYSYGPQP